MEQLRDVQGVNVQLSPSVGQKWKRMNRGKPIEVAGLDRPRKLGW